MSIERARELIIEATNHSRPGGVMDRILGRIEDALPKPITSSRDRTHWPDCWRYLTHHDCAVAKIERQQERIGELESEAADNAEEAAAAEARMRALNWPVYDTLGRTVVARCMEHHIADALAERFDGFEVGEREQSDHSALDAALAPRSWVRSIEVLESLFELWFKKPWSEVCDGPITVNGVYAEVNRRHDAALEQARGLRDAWKAAAKKWRAEWQMVVAACAALESRAKRAEAQVEQARAEERRRIAERMADNHTNLFDQGHHTIRYEDDDGRQIGWLCVTCDWLVDWTEWNYGNALREANDDN